MYNIYSLIMEQQDVDRKAAVAARRQRKAEAKARKAEAKARKAGRKPSTEKFRGRKQNIRVDSRRLYEVTVYTTEDNGMDGYTIHDHVLPLETSKAKAKDVGAKELNRLNPTKKYRWVDGFYQEDPSSYFWEREDGCCYCGWVSIKEIEA